MNGRYRSQRRPRTDEAPCTIATAKLESAFEVGCASVAAAPEPRDCPRCGGRGKGCGACGGLGFLAEAEWVIGLQLAFVAACGLVLPCVADEADGLDAA